MTLLEFCRDFFPDEEIFSAGEACAVLERALQELAALDRRRAGPVPPKRCCAQSFCARPMMI